MARYTKARCRQCRRAAVRLYLKGDRCFGPKCALERRASPPGGQSSGRMRRKLSDYGIRLQEKQKLKRIYGILESQFRRYFRKAAKRRGVTGDRLLQLLESRLDNVVYRLGFATSRSQARQLVGHRHFSVNGRAVDIPSYSVRPEDVIQVREKSKRVSTMVESLGQSGGRSRPDWLELDAEAMSGKVLSLPSRDQIDTEIRDQLVVEYYSR